MPSTKAQDNNPRDRDAYKLSAFGNVVCTKTANIVTGARAVAKNNDTAGGDQNLVALSKTEPPLSTSSSLSYPTITPSTTCTNNPVLKATAYHYNPGTIAATTVGASASTYNAFGCESGGDRVNRNGNKYESATDHSSATTTPVLLSNDPAQFSMGLATNREILIAFYTEHNSSKLDDIDTLLIEYAGKEEELLRRLEAKYKIPKSTTSSVRSGPASLFTCSASSSLKPLARDSSNNDGAKKTDGIIHTASSFRTVAGSADTGKSYKAKLTTKKKEGKPTPSSSYPPMSVVAPKNLMFGNNCNKNSATASDGREKVATNKELSSSLTLPSYSSMFSSSPTVADPFAKPSLTVSESKDYKKNTGVWWALFGAPSAPPQGGGAFGK